MVEAFNINDLIYKLNAGQKNERTDNRKEHTYKEVLDKQLKALDLSATTFCMENDIKVCAFGLKDPENIYRVVIGEKVGTEIHR